MPVLFLSFSIVIGFFLYCRKQSDMAFTSRRRLVYLQDSAVAEYQSSEILSIRPEIENTRQRFASPDLLKLFNSLKRRPCTCRKRPPFGSLAMSRSDCACRGKSQTSSPKPKREKLKETWMLASANEVEKVPNWRIALGNIASGATAGATVEAALYPLDTLKTRLQATVSGGGLRALIQGGGGKALYAGVWGNLAGVVPASAIFMGIYEPVKQEIARRVPENRNYLAALGGGALAGLAASFVRVPTEVVKQRLQTGEFTGALRAVSSITKSEGVRGLFAGYGSFLLRDLPFDALEFVAYEQLKKSYRASLKGVREPNSLEISGIGALAGAFTGVATTPLDVIKTRLMTQGSAKTYEGVLDCAQKIWKLEGGSAFLKGWQPRVIWIGLGGCVFFTALEEAKKLYLPPAALHPLPAGH